MLEISHSFAKHQFLQTMREGPTLNSCYGTTDPLQKVNPFVFSSSREGHSKAAPLTGAAAAPRLLRRMCF